MHDVIHIPKSQFSIFLFWHLWTTHPPRARVNTCTQVCTQLTHVLSRMVLSLTKPKGKIYKTKSLGHYITHKKRIRQDTTGMGGQGLSTGNWARNWNLTIRTNGICTPQDLSWKIRRTTPLGFWDINESHNLGQTTRDYNNQQKKKGELVELWTLCLLADHRVKLKENEKRDKYRAFARELKSYGTWKWRLYVL